MACLVLLGWHFHYILFVQILPDMAPMQYNSALAFLLGGLGLYFLNTGKKKLVPILGVVIFIFATLNLLQYILNINFGIDELFFRHHITVKTSHPGRMGINTALNHMAAALVLLVPALSGILRRDFWVGIISPVICSIALVSLFGYLIGVESTNGWWLSSHMSLPDEGLFCVLGGGFICWALAQNQNWFEASWFPCSVGILLLVLSLILWNGTRIEKIYQLEAVMQYHADSYIHALQNHMTNKWADTSEKKQREDYQYFKNELALESVMIFSKLLGEAYAIDLYMDGEKFLSSTPRLEISRRYALDKTFKIGDKIFELELRPTSIVVKQFITGLPNVVLIVSILLTISFTVLIQLLQVAQVREHQIGENLVRLKKTEKELKRVLRDLEEFSFVVSHDLKAPLRGIGTLTSIVLEDFGKQLDQEVIKYLTTIMQRVDRMRNMIEGILRYARIGKTTDRKERLDLNFVVANVIDLLEPPTNIKIVVAGSLPIILFSRVQMEQVFQNLIGNALTCLNGRQDGMIEVACRSENGEWHFSVKDNGPGIAREFHESIFQIFQTLPKEQQTESTGIGLTIVKKIVDLNGGRIWVESELGQGSTFHFSLPKVS